MTTITRLRNIKNQQRKHILPQRTRASLIKLVATRYTRRKLAARYSYALKKHDRLAVYTRAARRARYMPVNGQRTRSNAQTTRNHGRSETPQKTYSTKSYSDNF